METFGNKLYGLTRAAREALFTQGELTQLTYNAFDIAVRALQTREEKTLQITFPIGLLANNRPITGSHMYEKGELITRYEFLASHQLAINGIIRLVTIVEALLGDIVRAVILMYPRKLGSKKQISMEVVLGARSIEDIHLRATDALLYELSYKSPSEFAAEAQSLLGINLLECPAFHKYVEVKATRDIHIHNHGVANETYIRKAGTHVRVQSGMALPIDTHYFLQSYEACLQFTEWLQKECHDRWHSSDCEEASKQQLDLQLSPPSQK